MMDKRYLEFWGNFFLNAARSQEELEELTRLAKQGFDLVEAQMNLFRKFYGLEDTKESEMPEEGWLQKSFADFRRCYKDFLEIFGAVPKEEYDELASRYESLRKEMDEQRKASRLTIPEKTVYDQDELEKGIQDLMKRQSEQFKELMNSFATIYEKERPKRKSKK